MRALRTESTCTTVALRTWFLLTLVVWVVAVLLLATSPVGLANEVPVRFIAYWIVAVFATAALVNAVICAAGATRVFWVIVSVSLLFRFVGNLTPSGFQVFDLVPPLFAPNDVAYGASYLLFFVAIGWLVAKSARNIALLATLDSLGVMFFTGLISWHFALSPGTTGAGWDSLKSLLFARSGPVFDVGLLCLALVVASSDRRLSRRAYPLAASFGAFLIADGLYLGLPPSDGASGWPELFWALGVAFIGLSAMSTNENTCPVTQLSVSPRVVAAFWFSPPLARCTTRVPSGVGRYPAAIALLHTLGRSGHRALPVALRISLGTYASRRLRGEAKALAKFSERDRISEDLHDTLKQCVHSVPMMLEAYRKARQKDPEAAEDILGRAIQTSGEASYRISGPIRELQIGGETSALDVRSLLGQLLHNVERSFGIKTETDLQAPLHELSPERLAAIYRITSEALWNAARHSGATKIRFETRGIESVLLVKVLDDGRGFQAEQRADGMGLSLMRRRAEEAGGKLDVVSKPGRGTTIQIRFEDE